MNYMPMFTYGKTSEHGPSSYPCHLSSNIENKNVRLLHGTWNYWNAFTVQDPNCPPN